MDISLKDYDVIIAGAGPAGSVIAATVAQAGYRVLVLEKNASCGSPCAGYISKTINIEPPDESVIQSEIRTMRTYLPDLSFHDFHINGFVVDRPSFDTDLAMKAKACGAEIKWGSPLTGIAPGVVEFRGGRASSKIVAGADGVFSRTSSILGLKKQKFAVCAQYHMKGIRPLFQTSEILFNSDYAPGGYAWIYPTGEDSAKVGVGIITGSPRAYLDRFIRESPVADRLNGKITEYITGALPVGGLREKLCRGNILLAGDSAGMADPVTGAGINNAMLAGNIAGKIIIEALKSDDVAVLGRYENQIRRLLGKPLERSLEKRKKLETCRNNELLQKHLPELWVTFKQYWEKNFSEQ